MPTALPYLASPGSAKTALERIRAAATPERFTRDFVETKLAMKGGTGAAIVPFLKKIGFVASDGSPTELYKKFRNTSNGGSALGQAIKIGYKELLQVHEYFFDLKDKELLDLIVQVTGLDRENQITKLTFSTLNTIKSLANFEAPSEQETPHVALPVHHEEISATASPARGSNSLGLNLAYTINLNLPATSDQAVFNAIFRSLKEHLLNNEE